ncbi:MAG: hypothetical protein ACM359_13320 [Bacillota bacterium]
MNEDRIKELLQHADQANTPPAPQNLAQHVRQRVKQQHQLRIIGATVAILLSCLLTGLYLIQRPHPEHQIARQNPVHRQSIQTELARLEAEAQLHTLVAERMWAMENLTQRTLAAEKTASTLSPLAIIEQQRQRAALIIVDQADRHLLNNNQHQAAAKEYRQAIALFPETHAATLAQRRLEQMEHGKEGSI